MRLKVTTAEHEKHQKMVVGVSWTPANELCSVSDDKVMMKWKLDGEADSQVCELDSFVTDIQFQTSLNSNNTNEVFAVGCSDGSLRFYRKNGVMDRKIEAHTGAVTSLRWNSEGTALATSGEDGSVKQWSQTGNLQSKLATAEQSIYCVCWSPDNQSILFCSEQYITLKPLRVSAKPLKWKAHSATVMKVDWNAMNNLIVSAGEDCKYKIWDSYGRPLYTSKAFEYSITSIKWCPNGDYFGVGSYNLLGLCDKSGWMHSRSRVQSGSILSLDWTGDGTHLAGAGAAGVVCFGQVVDRNVEWRNYEATLTENNQVIVQDTSGDNPPEELEFGHRVIDLSIGFGHLVVVTAKACYIYQLTNLSAPHLFDLKGTVSLVLQTEKFLLLVDSTKGIQVFNYDGRPVSNPRLPNLQPQFLRQGNISLSNDTIALIDRANPTVVHLIDTTSGKPTGETIKHEIEVMEVAMAHSGSAADRKLVFIDRNRELFITTVQRATISKIATMVDSAIWHDTTEMLAAVSDGKFNVWYYPNVVYIDKDLVARSRSSVEASSLGKNPQFLSFYDSRCVLRRADGAVQAVSVSPYGSLLYKYTAANQWDKCVRVCRIAKEDFLWASVAAMAMHGHQLDTAEIALAALEEVDKLQYVQWMKDIPSIEGRMAAIHLFRRKPDEAEGVLLQAGLTYRAIKMNIDLFRWARSLELALSQSSHVDTVLFHRMMYLDAMGMQETMPQFLAIKDTIEVKPEAIRLRMEQEEKSERARGTPLQSSINVTAPPLTSLMAGQKSLYSLQSSGGSSASLATPAPAVSAPPAKKESPPPADAGMDDIMD